MSVRSAGLAGSSRRNGECLPVSSHYLDKPTYSTVLDYYRPRVLDETAQRRCQDLVIRPAVEVALEPARPTER